MVPPTDTTPPPPPPPPPPPSASDPSSPFGPARATLVLDQTEVEAPVAPATPPPPPPQPPADPAEGGGRRPGLPARSYLAMMLAGAVGAAAIVVPLQLLADNSPAPAVSGDTGTAPTPTLVPLPGAADGSLIATIAQRVTPSVVRIDVTGPTSSGSGSGVVLDSAGHILTNAHVVEGATEISVLTPDGDRLTGTLVGLDTSSDIAVVKVDATDLPVPAFAEGEPGVGELAVAIGSPFGLDGSVTAGIVSGVGRSLNGAGSLLLDLIQTDAAINPGNSGGALVNAAGAVVGINTAILSQSGANDGVGFAVPISTALDVAADLIEFGEVRAGYLGIEGQTVDPEVARLYNLTVDSGAIIASVQPDSPAATAGLVESDIIIAFDGTQIESMLDLASIVQRREPGEKVTLTIVRDAKEQKIQITLGTRP